MKKKTTPEQLEELLAEISADQLKTFVLEQALNDSHFRRLLKMTFIRAEDKESKAFYRKQIKNILRMAKDQGFINRPAMRAVNQQIIPLLNLANEGIQEQDFSTSFLICTVVLEEMTKAFNFADDSNGDLGDLIRFALDILKEISQAELLAKTRKAFFKYCLTTFKKESFKGWDWHFYLLEYASELFETKKEAQVLMDLLDEESYEGYQLGVIQVRKYHLIQKIEGSAAALLYLEQNIKNADLRKIALQEAFDQQNYTQVIVLANDGIEQDQEYAGLVNQWQKWLLKVAQEQKDTETIIKYARLFFMDNYRQEQDYYQLLKQAIPSKDWLDFVEALIREITAKGDWHKVSLIAKIYIQEKWWARLFELVQAQTSFSVLDAYEKYLRKDYGTDLVDLYAQQILEYLSDNAGRNYYRNACRYIRKMQQLGGGAKAQELIETLRKTYPKRTALLDELNKI